MASTNPPPAPDLATDESEDEDDRAATKKRARERLGTFIAQKWHLEGLLGVGGMASVFEARHRNGKRVAVKILHPELALSGDTLRRFLREGYLANAVEHPDVVSVLDDGMTDDGLPYLVMDYLEGESLDGRLERIARPLELPDVLSIACSLLDVLHAAHQRGIVHRDLKPDNVFLTIDGQVKVFDFGIARLQDARSNNRHATRTGVAIGTPTFMSREQAHGDAKHVDGRTDIWALGATLFYALTADFPYQARSVAEYMARLMTVDPRPLRSVVPEVPEPIAEVIDRALLHDLSRRWQNALDMRLRLIDAAKTAGVDIPPRPSTEGFLMPTAPRIRLASFPDERPSIAQRQKDLNSLPTSAGDLDSLGPSPALSPAPGVLLAAAAPGPAQPGAPTQPAPLVASPASDLDLPTPDLLIAPVRPGGSSPGPISPTYEPLPPPVPDAEGEPPPPPLRRRGPVGAVAALVLVAALGLVLWRLRSPEPRSGDTGAAATGAPGAAGAPSGLASSGLPTVVLTNPIEPSSLPLVTPTPPSARRGPDPVSTGRGPEPAAGAGGRASRPPSKGVPANPGSDLGATRN